MDRVDYTYNKIPRSPALLVDFLLIKSFWERISITFLCLEFNFTPSPIIIDLTLLIFNWSLEPTWGSYCLFYPWPPFGGYRRLFRFQLPSPEGAGNKPKPSKTIAQRRRLLFIPNSSRRGICGSHMAKLRPPNNILNTFIMQAPFAFAIVHYSIFLYASSDIIHALGPADLIGLPCSFPGDAP